MRQIMKYSMFKTGIVVFFLCCKCFVATGEEKPALHQLKEEDIRSFLSGKTIEKQVEFYDSLSNRWRGTDQMISLRYANTAVTLSEQVPNSKEAAHALFIRAKVFRQMSKYEKALKDLDSSLSLYKKLEDKVWEGTVYADYGNLYYKKAEYGKSLDYYLKGLECAEKTGDKELLIICLNNVGNIYFYTADYDRAINYYLRSYEINKGIGNIEKSALILDNIGLIYSKKEEYDMALIYQASAAKTLEKSGNKQLLGESYMNLGALYNSMEKYDGALEYFDKAYKLSVETGSKFYISGSLINIGDVYRIQGKYDESVKVLTEALTIAQETDAKFNIEGAAMNLSLTYEAMKQHENALKYYKLYSSIKDSIVNEESASQINELSAKYEADKKEQEIELLTKENDLNDTKLKQSRTLSVSLFVGIALVVILMGLVYYRYREKQKANSLLEEKNLAINEQKELVLEKNKEITDSINYAKRIQDAMLPSQKILNEYFKENFIFYQPKDIISGDFYWALRKNDHLYIAAADCTGHGVPGALMSMIGVTFLRQIINEMNVIDTAEILNKLHSLVLGALNEDISRRDSKDGMDVALLKIDILNKKAQFSGAVRPLYIVDKSGLEIIKGDRFSIGGVKTMEENFSKTDIDLAGGRSFYLFSDGFADQFGQAGGKKFMIRNLQKTIEAICRLPMDEQHKHLSELFNAWKGSLEQTDDVLLLGIRV